jgi:hypothetical protein
MIIYQVDDKHNKFVFYYISKKLDGHINILFD